MKIVIQTAMHKRQKTVKYCLDKMRDIDLSFVYGYTLKEDKEFLKKELDSFRDYTIYGTLNSPLWLKFQSGIDLLRDMDFDLLICLGSDDYVDKAFIDYVIEKSAKHDFIGFEDIYFEGDGKKYYWSGYTNHRVGEPCGAGKCYTKKGLELMDYNLFSQSLDRGLDNHAWNRVCKHIDKRLISSIRKEGLNLTDVKDGKGLTPLYLLSKGLTQIPNN